MRVLIVFIALVLYIIFYFMFVSKTENRKYNRKKRNRKKYNRKKRKGDQ